MSTKQDMTMVMLKALWTAFKWPALVFGLFMMARLLIGPIVRAIMRGFNR